MVPSAVLSHLDFPPNRRSLYSLAAKLQPKERMMENSVDHVSAMPLKSVLHIFFVDKHTHPCRSEDVDIRMPSMAPTESSLFTEAYYTAFEGTPMRDLSTPSPTTFVRRQFTNQDYERMGEIKEEEYEEDVDGMLVYSFHDTFHDLVRPGSRHPPERINNNAS
jgi:hypothetical protein